MPDVQHDTSTRAFTAAADGGTAKLEYTRQGDRIIFTHTFVPKEARGQDVGSSLVREGLGFAREEGLTVVPQCPFVEAYMDKNPDTKDLL